MLTLIISIIFWTLFWGLIVDTERPLSYIVGATLGSIFGSALAIFLLPAEFEEQIASFPLEKTQYTDTASKAFFEVETVSGSIDNKKFYIVQYYGEEGTLKQEKFLSEDVVIKPTSDTVATIEFKKFSRQKGSTKNLFSLQFLKHEEITIYLPDCQLPNGDGKRFTCTFIQENKSMLQWRIPTKIGDSQYTLLIPIVFLLGSI